jgi:acyl carrier protein
MDDTHSAETQVARQEADLAALVVEALKLEDVSPGDIEPDAPLFGAGLGLDSLDMLELSMAIEQKHGIKLRSDDPDNEKIFASLRSLARHIHRPRAS